MKENKPEGEQPHDEKVREMYMARQVLHMEMDDLISQVKSHGVRNPKALKSLGTNIEQFIKKFFDSNTDLLAELNGLIRDEFYTTSALEHTTSSLLPRLVPIVHDSPVGDWDSGMRKLSQFISKLNTMIYIYDKEGVIREPLLCQLERSLRSAVYLRYLAEKAAQDSATRRPNSK